MFYFQKTRFIFKKTHFIFKNHVLFQKDTFYFSTSICYESIFGESISRSFQNRSQCLFIITNDGWWKDSPGYKQHLSYSRLRAIENRKNIVRSANTGVSAVINYKGEILESVEYGVEGFIKTKVGVNEKKHFTCYMVILFIEYHYFF